MPSKDYLGRLLEAIAIFSFRSPLKVLLAVALVTVGAVFFARGLNIDPALKSLIPQERPAVKEFIEIERDFQHTEFMISVVELPKELPVIRYRKFLREYQKRLEQIPELDADRLDINSRFVKKVKEFLGRHGLLLLGEKELTELNRQLNPESLQAKLRAAKPYRLHLWRTDFDPLDVLPGIRAMLPLGDRTFLDRSNEFFLTRDPHTLFFIVGNDYPWLWDRTKKIVKQAAEIERQAWNEVMPEVQAIHSGQNITYPKITWIGKAMDVLRMTDVIGDAFTGTILWTSLLVALVFLCFFPNVRALVLSYFPVILGLVWSLAFARLTVGSLNMLSVLCWGVMIGLGIDFPTYLLNRYYQHRQSGLTAEEALRRTWRETGRPVCIGALNVILVFTLLIASHLPAFRDIGIICSSGLLIILFLVLTTVPAMIKLSERRRASRPLRLYPRRLIQIPLGRPGWTVALTLLLFGSLSFFISHFRFLSPYDETYFMFRQPAELLSEADRRFGELMGSSINSFRLIVSGNTWEEALHKNEQLFDLLAGYRAKGKIAYVDSLLFWMPSRERQERRQQVLAGLPYLNPNTFAKEYSHRISGFLLDEKTPREEKAAYRIYGEALGKLLSGRQFIGIGSMQELDLEKIFKHYHGEKDGKILLSSYIYLPRGNPPRLKEDLMVSLRGEKMFQDGEVRYSSEEEMIGEVRKTLEEDLVWLGGLSLVATTLLLWIAFRSVKMTLYASIPMYLGGAAAIGAYTLFRGDYSIFNILWVPIYIGMATDDALHIGSRMKEGSVSLAEALRQTGSMVVLTSVTTMIGFGSSLFTDLEIIKRASIWIVTALLTELVASLFLFPALLQIDGYLFGKRNKNPPELLPPEKIKMPSTLA